MADKRPLVLISGQYQLHANADQLYVGQGIYLAEQGTAPSTPSAGYGILYVKTDGLLYFKNDSGVETLLS